jgi:hypothetical protein
MNENGCFSCDPVTACKFIKCLDEKTQRCKINHETNEAKCECDSDAGYVQDPNDSQKCIWKDLCLPNNGTYPCGSPFAICNQIAVKQIKCSCPKAFQEVTHTPGNFHFVIKSFILLSTIIYV